MCISSHAGLRWFISSRVKEPPNEHNLPRAAFAPTSPSCPSFSLLDQGMDPSKGAMSREFGFMGDPKALLSCALPQSLLETARNIPQLYATEGLRKYVEALDFTECIRGLEGYDLLLAKSIIFTLAQAYVDCGRIDRGPDQPKDTPPPFPPAFEKTLQVLSARVDTVSFCVLSDICLYNVKFSKDVMSLLAEERLMPTYLTFEDMNLNVPVLTGLRRGESEAERAIRGNVESRFFLTTVEMGYATCDMPRLVAEAQQAMYLVLQSRAHRTDARAAAQAVVQCLKKLKESAIRMKSAFGKMRMKDVPAKVWHKDVAKLTLGYNGNGGPSGPQHPTVHLLDIFIGRKKYSSELGEVIVNTRSLLSANHRQFLTAVENGPTIQEFLSCLETCLPSTLARDVASAANDLVEEYMTSGFLTAHRKKAYAYLRSGFAGQVPRTFTAGSTYNPYKDVPKQMLESFAHSLSERDIKFQCKAGQRARAIHTCRGQTWERLLSSRNIIFALVLSLVHWTFVS